jgi:hypothetical protein
MPGVHKHQTRTYRPDPDLFKEAKRGVEALDSSLNAHICAFLRWLTHETDELPERPPAELFADSK